MGPLIPKGVEWFQNMVSAVMGYLIMVFRLPVGCCRKNVAGFCGIFSKRDVEVNFSVVKFDNTVYKVPQQLQDALSC